MWDDLASECELERNTMYSFAAYVTVNLQKTGGQNKDIAYGRCTNAFLMYGISYNPKKR